MTKASDGAEDADMGDAQARPDGFIARKHDFVGPRAHGHTSQQEEPRLCTLGVVSGLSPQPAFLHTSGEGVPTTPIIYK